VNRSSPPAALSSSRQRTDPPNLLSRKSSRSPNILPQSDEAASPRPSSKSFNTHIDCDPIGSSLPASSADNACKWCRNAAFEKAGHTRLVAPKNEPVAEEGSIDLLVQLLLPLCGNEEFDIDVGPRKLVFLRGYLPSPGSDDHGTPAQVLDELPAELQLLPPDKKREPDAQIRGILVETLVLLATTRANRDAMRARGGYPIIKEAHLQEQVPAVSPRFP
jgi:hypothetical protein